MQDMSTLSDDQLRRLHAAATSAPQPQQTQPVSVIVRRANPAPEIRAQNADARAEARLELARAAAARADAAAARDAARFAQEQAEKAGTGRVRLTNEDRGRLIGQYRGLANIARGVNSLRQQYQQSLAGRNPFEGRVGAARPEDAVFNNTSGALTAYMAGMLGLSGQQFNTPAEQELFIGSLLPKATDTDEAIVAKLNDLDAMLANARGQGQQLLGLTPETDILEGNRDVAAFYQRVAPQQNALPGNPTVLPQARGAQADPGIAADGVVDAGRGGSRVVPELFGLGDEIASIIQQGGTREQAIGHYQARMTEAGIAPSPDQIRDITYLSAQHRANPRAPVKSLMTGWEQFHMVETPDEGGSLLGAVADSPVGAAVIGAAQGFSAGNLGNVAGADAQSVLDYSRAERPVSTFMGDAVGSTAMMLAGGGLANAAARGTGMLARGGRAMSAMGGLGVDTAYGGIRGASEAAPGERLSGAFLGGVMAGTGNRVGAGAANLTGRAVRGVSDPAVRYLSDRGINMSMGQLLGNRSMLGRTINRLESVPVLGDMLSARRAESIGDYGRAQLAENLGSIGYTPPPGPFSQDMLADAQRAVGDSYNFLDGRTFATDPQGIADIGSALNAGRSVPRVGEEFDAVVNRNVGPLFDQSGNFTGQGYQDALQQLRSARSSFGQDGAMGNMAADATSQLEDALNGIVARQAPDVAPQMRAANEAYRGLVPIENAAITGTNNGGLFTPAQYGRAAANNTRNFGGRAAAARGDVPGGELQRAAQDIIPSTIPDSGTAGRGMAAMLLPAALGGAAIGANTIVDYPITSAGLGALALLSTRGGSRMLQRGMVGRAGRQQRDRLGNMILRNQDAAGTIGAAGGALLIPALSSSGQ